MIYYFSTPSELRKLDYSITSSFSVLIDYYIKIILKSFKYGDKEFPAVKIK